MSALLAWVGCAVWNSVKPPPAGTHVVSLSVRLAESQVDFIDDESRPGAARRREAELIGRAVEAIVVDQCPLPQAVAEALLLRKRQRPNLKILLVTDPRNETYGGTAARTLIALERAGISVARLRLERMRDPDPLYSSLWRLTMGWWSDPFDDLPGEVTAASWLRRHNFKIDARQLLVADDGVGGWTSLVMTNTAASETADTAMTGTTAAGLEIRGHLARELVASELRLAAWSTDDDRLPTAPPVEGPGVGTIDARLVTEGAIQTALRDALAAAQAGDSIDIAARGFDERQLLGAARRAAGRGARLRLLLDPDAPATLAAAGELRRDAAGQVEVRWRTGATRGTAGYALIQHRGDLWTLLGSANFTRRGLDDLDVDADVELHMPANAAPARAVAVRFARQWASAAEYARQADESAPTYWRYRLAAATGLALF